MAGLGMNVITVLHQPRFSIFSLFDDVMLLCKGGRLAYLGPSRAALPYLESLGFQLPRNENPADFAMDVLSGSVPRAGAPSFQPEELVPLWAAQGAAWVRAQQAAGGAGAGAGAGGDAGAGAALSAPRPAPEAVDPEQLRLLEVHFNDADADGDGAITAGELKGLLVGLGLEPTDADVEVIAAELAGARAGLIRKEGFMQYVRYGGRPPTADAAPGELGGSKRRVDSLYRVYSIEQYSLGAALAEMAAAQLPAALKAGTLKDMASAMVVAGGQGGAAPGGAPRKRTLTLTAVAGGAPEADAAAVEVAIPEGEELRDSLHSEAARTASGTDSVASLHLPPPSPPPAAAHLAAPSLDSRRASSILHDVGAALPEDRGAWHRALAWCGLDAGSGSLRSTPGVFGQLVVLLSRAWVKWVRNWSSKMMDLLLLIFAAVACGERDGRRRRACS
jgi:hypothetical protein